MKYLFILIMSCILFYGCPGDNCSTFPNQLYMEGEVLIRAEKDYPTGVIKVKNVFRNDESIESPARGILYTYNEDQSFDLEQEIYFKVIESNGMQMATDVKKSLSSSDELMSKRDCYRYRDAFQINLHNADEHREGPKHRIWHVGSGGGGLTTAMNNYNLINNPNVYLLEDPENKEERLFYLDNGESMIPGVDYYVYYSTTPLNTSAFSHPSYAFEDSSNVFYVSTTHDHSLPGASE